MSGIAGVVRFERELSDDSTVSDLLRGLEHRALDGSITRRHGRAEFGYAHTALRRNHPASDHIDVCARTNRLIVVDASLHNACELAESCGLASARDPQVVPIARVLLAAYEKWGKDLADKLRGDFALVIWDPATKELYAARDAFGCRPLFLAHRLGEFAFASEVQSLVAADFVELKPNMVALSDFIVYSTHRAFEASFVQGINRVRAGHYAVIGSSGMTQVRYWPVPGIALNVDVGGQEDLASGFRRMLKASVAANMASVDGPLAIELSGGYDSSAITLLAAEHLAASPRGAPTHLVSFVYPGLTCDESPYSEAVAACTSFPHVKIPAPSLAAAELGFAASARHGCSPVIDPSWPRTQAWGQALRSLDARVAFTGIGGDDLTWDPDYALAHAFEGRYFRAVVEAVCSRQKPSVRAKAMALRRLVGVIAGKALRKVAPAPSQQEEVPQNLEPWVRRDMLVPDHAAFPPVLRPEDLAVIWGKRATAELVSWLISPEFLGAIEFIEIHASGQGITLLHPFLNRDLVDSVLRMTSDRRKGYPWRIKSLLLQALQAEWPASLLSRGSKTSFDTYFVKAYESATFGLAKLPHCSGELIDWDKVELARGALEPLLRTGKTPGLFGQGRSMWIPICVETWLAACDYSG
jgi:asparagine synthase (glutamine-hydrolysing)